MGESQICPSIARALHERCASDARAETVFHQFFTNTGAWSSWGVWAWLPMLRHLAFHSSREAPAAIFHPFFGL